MAEHPVVRFMGFGAALREAPPINEAELLLPAMAAAQPPAWCPACCMPTSGASRDERGNWTWNCFGGCNP